LSIHNKAKIHESALRGTHIVKDHFKKVKDIPKAAKENRLTVNEKKHHAGADKKSDAMKKTQSDGLHPAPASHKTVDNPHSREKSRGHKHYVPDNESLHSHRLSSHTSNADIAGSPEESAAHVQVKNMVTGSNLIIRAIDTSSPNHERPDSISSGATTLAVDCASCTQTSPVGDALISAPHPVVILSATSGAVPDSGMTAHDISQSIEMPQKDASPADPELTQHTFDFRSIDDNPFAEEMPDTASFDNLVSNDQKNTSPVASASTSSVVSQAQTPPSPPVQNTSSPPVEMKSQSAVQPPLQSHLQPEKAPELNQLVRNPLENAGPLPTPAGAVSKNVPSEENSAKIDKLTGQIRQLEESMTSLRQMYMDGVITRNTYDSTRDHIEEDIRDDKITISLEKEKAEIERLKETVDKDIKSALDDSDFEGEADSLRQDISRLEKLHEDKVIDDATYELSKEKITDRVTRINNLVGDVNTTLDSYFRKYAGTFEEEILKRKMEAEKKAEEARKEKEPAPVAVETKIEPKKEDKTLVHKIAKMFRILKKEKHEAAVITVAGYKDELVHISKLKSKRDAILELRFLLKNELQKKLGIDKQLTYDNLVLKLPNLKSDSKLREDLVAFFRDTSDAEYKGSVKEQEYSTIYEKVVLYLKQIENIGEIKVPKKEEKKK